MAFEIGRWKTVPKNAAVQLNAAIEKGLARAPAGSSPVVFFRADDIGVPSRFFFKMTRLFIEGNIPLCLAVVPAWATEGRWSVIREQTAGGPWFWHQHGWRHMNHEKEGKKQEFGPGRSYAALEKDILAGKNRLESILGDAFQPVFTPPWNRCSKDALFILQKAGFRAISRSTGARPPAPAGLTDHAVTIDLNTRKEPGQKQMWENFLSEITRSMAQGTAGVMLHHQRMTPAGFDILELVLQAVGAYPEIRAVSFAQL